MKLNRAIYIALSAAFLITISISIYFALKALHYKTVEAVGKPLNDPLYHLVLIPEEMDNPYWHLVEKGAKDAAKKYHVAVEYNGPQQTDMDQHNRVIEEAIASKADGIITQGLYPKRTTSVIDQAIQQGIPVVTVDTDAPKSQREAYVGTDNYQSGVLAGRTLITEMHGHAKVGIITGSFESANQQARVAGFKEAIKKAPGVQIVDIEESNITQVQAAEKTYEILKKYPDVNAFFGTSALDGLGISAVTTRYAPEQHIYVLAYDTLESTLDEIRKGTIDQTISQTPYEMGYKSVELMVDILNGKQVPKLNYTDSKVIGKEDLFKEREVH